MESLSTYARQFIGQMDKPDVELIEGLSPALVFAIVTGADGKLNRRPLTVLWKIFLPCREIRASVFWRRWYAAKKANSQKNSKSFRKKDSRVSGLTRANGSGRRNSTKKTKRHDIDLVVDCLILTHLPQLKNDKAIILGVYD